MTPEPCANTGEIHETSRELCARCMSFYKGLVIALMLSGLAWGIIVLIIYYVVR